MDSYYAYGFWMAILCATSFHFVRRRSVSSLPLPPGPPPHIIMGNTIDMPDEKQWESFTRLGKIYGPIFHLRVLTKHIIVLNSLEAVTDLMDKRGGIYSDRPESTMVCELMKWGWATSLMRYGEDWRANRRVVHYLFHKGASKQYQDQQTQLNLEFLRSLLHSPSSFMQHIRKLTGLSMLKITYGMEGGEQDHWVEVANEAIEIMTAALVFGRYAVDLLPILKYVPAWFPGASFQKIAQESAEISDRLRYGPLEWVRQQHKQGKTGVSIAERLMQDGLEGRSISEELLADVTAVIYIGGTDTTVSVISAFFLCMVLYPGAQKAAQQEIDRVLGHGSLPQFTDRDSLPYTNGILLETMRLYPVLPLGLGHRVMEDDEYSGMRIPKGATVIANVWAMLRDEGNYANPEQFMPERYLKDGVFDLQHTVPDPRGPLFGFGRRICPGRHFADAAAWLAVATTLACFNIERARNPDGNEIVPDGELRTGGVTCVRPFPCVIKPRSEATRNLLVNMAETV